MISLEGEEATHKSELTVNRSRKNLSETFHPLPASLSHAPGNLPGGPNSIEAVSRLVLVDGKRRHCLKLLTTT
ncbi:Uncharacterized protein APZ42_024966 [Daphnia magna]|uniref:Uncharacterized protein n=1 Tax=Daphnia magna TaxID=35525 RepID=A0A164TL42_9CRUS|nr:Uncharacterized protein APZ42_024966 [Daphnia magna]